MAGLPGPDFDHECFLISPIGSEDSDVRRRADGVRDYIVRPAADELGLIPVRADDIAQPGQITLQVIEHVLTARAAVADLTGANPNVFYELAVRHTARLPVVLIAHEDDRDKLPFDIAQMRTVFYDHQDLKSAADCRAQIATQLREALEQGAVDSPVAASVNLAHLQGGNPSEQVLAQLVSTVESMAADTGRLERMMDSILRDGTLGSRAVDPRAVDEMITAVMGLEALSASRNDQELQRACRDVLRPASHLLEGRDRDPMRGAAASKRRRRYGIVTGDQVGDGGVEAATGAAADTAGTDGETPAGGAS